METLYTSIALITAGVSLFAGLVNLFIGFHKDGEKIDVLFGFMCLSMFIFFMIPPVGFILRDHAPYSLQIDIKRIFNCAFNCLFPWFALLYTGYKKKLMPYIISLVVIISYGMMALTKTDSQKPLWTWFVVFGLTLNLSFGFYTAYLQVHSGKTKKARWFISAMCFFAVFYLLTVINQVSDNYFGRVLGTKLFFPVNLFPLSFIVIMGLHLRMNVFEKYRLEKVLRWRDVRWNSLVKNMELLVVELDNTGHIRYINPYAIKALGYNLETELIGKNWFDCFTSKEELAERKSFYMRLMSEGELIPHETNELITKNGSEIIIGWTNVFTYDDLNRKGIVSIGLNVTEQQKAFDEIQVLKTELEKESLLLENGQQHADDVSAIIGRSEAILYAIQKAKQVATTNATVLLEGETGVGKELFANLVHQHSYRNNKPFIKVNCAALPAELIESELFGHEKGSFTSAFQLRKGRFELADGGTIFLDEISELPLSLQPKLLRVLQSGEFERLGAQETIKVDVRVISATNRDLSNEVKDGHFREDLYYRLNVFPITIPPLRNRSEDIPLLVGYFAKKLSHEHHKQLQTISKADMIRLREYSWPGNIRELINVMERSVISTTGNVLKLDWPHSPAPAQPKIYFSMEDVERAHILKILKDCNWKINGDSGAALKLGLHPNTLRSRLKKLNISRADV